MTQAILRMRGDIWTLRAFSAPHMVGVGRKFKMSSSEPRRRNPPGAGEQDQKDLAREAIAGAIKDPLVRTSAKPPDESKVDEKWDLEDDENWVDGQNPTERTEDDVELAKRRRVLKRDSIEVGTAFVFHLAMMCVFIYIHVYDATIVKRNKGKGFEGLATYGGRWKFLTYINLVRKYHKAVFFNLHGWRVNWIFIVDRIRLFLPLFLHGHHAME